MSDGYHEMIDSGLNKCEEKAGLRVQFLLNTVYKKRKGA